MSNILNIPFDSICMQNMYAFSIMDCSKVQATWDWIKVISYSTEKQEPGQDLILRWRNKSQNSRFFKNGLCSVTGKLASEETAMVTCRAGGESAAKTASCKVQS